MANKKRYIRGCYVREKNTDRCYLVVSATEQFVIVKSKEGEEIAFKREKMERYLPLEIGKRYIFTGINSITGIYEISEIRENKFKIDCDTRWYGFEEFFDITPIETEPVFKLP